MPPDTTSSPNFTLDTGLMNAFETGDLRRTHWVDSTDYSGTYFYFPNKYPVYVGNPGDTPYYTMLRLAEQYLIRAESEANQGGSGITGAIADLDTLRARAGLPFLSSSLNQTQVLVAVAQERRIELFAEWGHRWFDLKRTGMTSILQSIKPQWSPDDTLWPKSTLA